MAFKYAEVIIAISSSEIDRVFLYKIPDELIGVLKCGFRVIVPFGRSNKKTEGYVISFSDVIDFDEAKVKSIISLLDDYPVFTSEMIEIAKFMKDKYFTTLSACLQCIMPTGIKVKKESDFFKPKFKNAGMLKLEHTDFVSGDVSLTLEQSRALSLIRNCENGVLLHGITGSGKTEIYMQLIEEAEMAGKQSIVLVPEISLTTQIVNRFVSRFGEKVLITHSRMSNSERFDQWKKARCGQYSIMIGPRSAIFTPFENLGVIVIDEEHENTYKSETSPKYHVVEIAKQRCRLTGAKLIMGSATPKIETYFDAVNGELSLITLKERANNSSLPEMKIVDMREELLNGNRSIFSLELKKEIEYNLIHSHQTILFLNRRGHSSFVSCRKCGYVMKCNSCNVSYTYHLYNDFLLCHYCGTKEKTPKECPACGSSYIKYFGVGTQKIQEEILKVFPSARVLRMDMDTTTRKNSHANILRQFTNGNADILIGTQMIAKGLDFPNVTLVGIIAADMSLNTGDYRASEITFQLITQVAGRAGRGSFAGKVLVQTYSPENYAIELALKQNYELFYSKEILLRRQMNYPPFSKLFVILFTGEIEKNIIVVMFKLLEIMKKYNIRNSFEILGPAPAFISKIKNRYRWKFIIKCAEEERLKNYVLYCIDKLKQKEDLSEFNVNLTSNPVLMY